jgi:hypothetical protein
MTVAKKEELSISNIELVKQLIHGGATFEEALSKKRNYRVLSPKLVLKKSVLKKILYEHPSYKGDLTGLVCDAIRGVINGSKLVFYQKKPDKKYNMVSCELKGTEGDE